MDFFDKIKDKTKKTLDHVDWEEVDNKSNKVLHKIKEIKDDYEHKVLEFKDDYDQRLRAQKEDALYKKEEELKEIAKRLAAEEELLKKIEAKLKRKEAKLKEKENKPKHVFFGCVFFLVFAFVLLTVDFTKIDFTIKDRTSNLQISSASKESSKKAQKGKVRSTSKVLTKREQYVNDVYRGIDIRDSKFDVGGYCLKKEKSGLITFEECIGLAGMKIIDSK